MAPASLASSRLSVRWEMLLFVVIVPTALAVSDKHMLQWCESPGSHVQLGLTFFWFCVQTAGIAMWVGRQLDRSPIWWGILAWTVLLIDLQALALAGSPGTWGGPAKTLTYAFVSSQAGLAIVWAVMGSETWLVRLPVCAGVFAWALSMGFVLQIDAMVMLLLGQTTATAAACLVMRSAGFRFAPVEPFVSRGMQGEPARRQFSLRHLFYWTTALAILTGLGRFVGWGELLTYFPLVSLPHLVLYTGLLTLVSLVGTWMALGRESWPMRLLLGWLLLPAIGVCIAFLDPLLPEVGGHGLWDVAGWRQSDDPILPSVIWTTLAGLFLSCILLVFRAHGRRLYRMPLIVPRGGLLKQGGLA